MNTCEADSGPREDILIVDDTPSVLKLLTDTLTQANYRVRPASDGELALRSIRAQSPAMILLDIRMPGMDGYEVCRRLKEDATTRAIPVVFLSALGEESDKVRAFQAGGVDYLTKPFYTEEVLARVRTQLTMRRMRLDLEHRNAELRAMYDTLEDRVNQRTAELQREIDEHRRTAESLRQSEARFRVMADTVPDILFTNRPDGWIDYMNSRFSYYTGLPPGSGMGFTWTEAFLPEDRSRLTQLVMEGLKSGEPLEYEFRLKGRHESHRWFAVRVRPISDEHGQIVKWFGAGVDIHDLKMAKEQLQQLNEALESRVLERTALAEHRANQLRLLAAELTQAEERERRRIARILHDQLQQILVVARMKMKLVCDRCEDDGLRAIGSEIDDLLNEAIQESRSLTASLSPPVLYERGLVAGLEWLARNMREQWGMSIDLHAETEAEPAELDARTLLFQVARELLLNVAKHANTDRARVELTGHGEHRVSLIVADEGVGFDPAVLEHQESTGGFGLFSLRERLELIDGALRIDAAVGSGTRIVVEVPRCRTRPGAPPAAPTTQLEPTVPELATAPGEPGKIRVLLVDDHAIVRQGLAGLLGEHATMEVVGEAADGQQAIELALALQPDVILMDVSMPNISGIEATRRILESLPHTRIIGLSMHEAEDMAAAMTKAGAVAYLRKDSHAEILLSAILHQADAAHNRPNSHLFGEAISRNGSL